MCPYEYAWDARSTKNVEDKILGAILAFYKRADFSKAWLDAGLVLMPGAVLARSTTNVDPFIDSGESNKTMKPNIKPSFGELTPIDNITDYSYFLKSNIGGSLYNVNFNWPF